MSIPEIKKRIAIIGGGPSGLFAFKRFVESGVADIEIEIFEKGPTLGSGMPYSRYGANTEHVTNVSGNEIPEIVTPLTEWVKGVSEEVVARFDFDIEKFNEFKVLPRLLFGQYLHDQFSLLLQKAKEKGLSVCVHYNTRVTDIALPVKGSNVLIEITGARLAFDFVIMCTGHHWPRTHEGKVAGYFDSPYPPAKLEIDCNHAVAIKGASLTAIDAIRTLARHNGKFVRKGNHRLSFQKAEDKPNFKIILHSRHGLLPGIRFHLSDPRLSKKSLLTDEALAAHMKTNDGFLSLDFIFEKDFKEIFIKRDPGFYDRIKDLRLEEFVSLMMDMREHADPFFLFKSEYEEAAESIDLKKSIYWKELLAILSFAMNYPAKHFSAEDMLRLQMVLMPLISLVIAFVPQSSCEELMALHDAGNLEIVSVGSDSEVIASENGIIWKYVNAAGVDITSPFKTFIDCSGQPHLPIEAFPFKSLIDSGAVSEALIRFRSPENGAAMSEKEHVNVLQKSEEYYLKVPGIAINDCFQPIDVHGTPSTGIYIMAVPYIGGYNPDYSGLDFCEEASGKIVKAVITDITAAS